ncbi:TPA: replication initiation protein [Campylobacter jejuni]|nr:replication initiation protein [Campylobacter jejuni]HDZ5084674.1 replication initiation protein [Campylobacter jejuni]
MKPYLPNLARYTKIQQVKYIKNFESKYSIRFYTLLKDYRKMSQRDFSIEALNKIFELPKNYENYRNFCDYVLKPAITEINAKSDLWVSEPEIIGKKG